VTKEGRDCLDKRINSKAKRTVTGSEKGFMIKAESVNL
jgi:hypothetical protein